MKILYFGTYRRNYSRNQILIQGLRSSGDDVIECNEVLWQGIDDRVDIASGGWLKPKFWWRVIACYTRLIRKYYQIGDYDVMVCGYPGQIDVFLGWVLTRLKGKLLVWDVFMSLYLISLERGLQTKNKLSINLIRVLENSALRLPDLLIQDTKEYVDWFQRIYHIPAKRFKLVPTGADNRIFLPREEKIQDNDRISILYYGTFIRNHGVDVILKAVEILKNRKNLVFVFAGDGPERSASEAFVRDHELVNTIFLGWLDQSLLAEEISQSDLCLGVFGETEQSNMTVQNKIFECLAMKRAVITGDSLTIRTFFNHGEHLYICNRNPEALSDAILFLTENPNYCKQLAERGFELFKKEFSLEKLGQNFKHHLENLVQVDPS